MNGVELRPCAGAGEWPRLVEVWRSAVEATHDFLAAGDITYYEQRIISDYLPQLDVTVAVSGDGARIVGFSGLADGKLEMLFVDARQRGGGVGSALLRDALAKIPGLLVDVNEQNPQAVEFYRRKGFRTIGRSATDGDGRPFPLLHLAAGDSGEGDRDGR
ncbi:putative N-acetyltransferase YjaB [Streptomyces sp. YIM 130001]|uniref:acetyltransferase n=1 Tax=Streptomyces sp. YIM 130001 TaxID=2259644 RepID=UPI000E65D765|nr:acetyltransferase [Streptomyces sp. YIM 130001]RII15928.1 putative N-acetyltransferase YjaB [Streptomyces sp. YIM 130001]